VAAITPTTGTPNTLTGTIPSFLLYSLDPSKAAAVEDDYLNPSKAPSEEVKAALYIPKEVRSGRILNNSWEFIYKCIADLI
jgi:hypothetical protein